MTNRILTVSLLAAVTLLASGEYSGRRAPSFSLPDANLVYYDILDYRGKVLLLDFMSAGCQHCREAAPVFEKVRQKYGSRVAILSIVTFPTDNQRTVSEYIKDTKTTVPILFDSGQVTGNYLKATPTDSKRDMPRVFVIDPSGLIRNDFGYGPKTKEIFDGPGLFAEIDKAMVKKTPAPSAAKK